MARNYRNEVVDRSPMEAMDGSVARGVVNASGTGTSSMELAERRSGGPKDSNTPGTGTQASRRPIEIDAVTGQRLADGVNANLDAAAQHPAGDPYELTAGQMRQRFESRWSNVHLKRAAMADVLQDASAAQYAHIPGMINGLRSFERGHQAGNDITACALNTRTLHHLFGGPSQECC